MRTAVIGAGGWGTTIAMLLAKRGHDVVLWARRKEFADALNASRENRTYLPSIPLPPEIIVTHEPSALASAELIVFAVPTQATRGVATELRSYLSNEQAVYLSASKGIERATIKRVTEVLAETLHVDSERCLALSGPSHAEEVSRGVPTATVVAGEDQSIAKQIQAAFLLPTFRVYSSTDLVGVELAGALKNVIAICAGLIDGLGFGDNTKAALMTRGLAEMRRLGVALGAEEHTFSGLAGLGDLVVTCASHYSRNRYVGEEIGKGRTLNDVLRDMTMVAEGVTTADAARELAALHHIEMPIVEETYQILFHNKDPRQATEDLMTRNPKSEHW